MSTRSSMILARTVRSIGSQQRGGRLQCLSKRSTTTTSKNINSNGDANVPTSSAMEDECQGSPATRRIISATNAPVTVTESNVNVNVNTTKISRVFSSLASASASAPVADEGQTVPTKDKELRSPSSSPSKRLDESFNEGILDSSITLETLRSLALKPCTPLSLSDMYKYASANANSKNYGPQRLRNAQFLYKELPIRMAQRAVDLITLPHGLNKTPPVQEIARFYLNYLEKLESFPYPDNEERELEFTDMLRTIIQDRTSIPTAIAKGVATLRDNRKEELNIQRLQEMEKALYRFFNARTGLRLLTEHHILSCVEREKENEELRKIQSCINNVSLEKGETSFLGCIQSDCDPYVEVKRVADQIMKHCKDCYGTSPEIEVLDCTPERYADSNFTYVPHHLQYTVAELLKNSCRATVRRHLDGKYNTEDHVGSHHNEEGVSEDTSLPSVKVVIAKGAEDVTIKIADKGGGVPRSVIGKMWTFAHSSMKKNDSDTNFETDEFSGSSSIRGFNIRGFGLPLARIYARYFGGELTLKSMEGYGVDAYLYLPVLGDACENLPERVQKSPAGHDSVHDGNHHAYYGDSFSSAYLSAEEPWSVGTRHFSDLAFKKLDRSSS